MQVVEYWEVRETYFDQRDGYDVSIACFASEEVANIFAENKPNYRVQKRKTLVVFDSVQDYNNRADERVRKAALAKLTPQERVALGIA